MGEVGERRDLERVVEGVDEEVGGTLEEVGVLQGHQLVALAFELVKEDNGEGAEKGGYQHDQVVWG